MSLMDMVGLVLAVSYTVLAFHFWADVLTRMLGLME